MTYYSSVFGPHMLGAGDWQDALKKSKSNKPGLSMEERFSDARKILKKIKSGSPSRSISFGEDEIKYIPTRREERDVDKQIRIKKGRKISKERERKRRMEELLNIPGLVPNSELENLYNPIMFENSEEGYRTLPVYSHEPEDIRIVDPRENRIQQPQEIKYEIAGPEHEIKIPGEYFPTLGELEHLERQYRYCDVIRKLDECRSSQFKDMTHEEAEDLRKPANDDPLLQSVFGDFSEQKEHHEDDLKSRAKQLLRSYTGDKQSYLDNMMKIASKTNNKTLFQSIIRTIEDEKNFLGSGTFGGSDNLGSSSIVWGQSPLLYESLDSNWDIHQNINQRVRDANPYEVDE